MTEQNSHSLFCRQPGQGEEDDFDDPLCREESRVLAAAYYKIADRSIAKTLFELMKRSAGPMKERSRSKINQYNKKGRRNAVLFFADCSIYFFCSLVFLAETKASTILLTVVSGLTQSNLAGR